jgi:hypothetical protein
MLIFLWCVDVQIKGVSEDARKHSECVERSVKGERSGRIIDHAIDRGCVKRP